MEIGCDRRLERFLRSGLPFWLALCLGAAAGLGAAPARAEESPPVAEVVVESVRPEASGRGVEVFFRALDEAGRPVRGLASQEVTLLQDGAPVAIGGLFPLERPEERALPCVLALDASRTMLGEPFEAARRSALATLDALSPGDPVAVVAFSDRVVTVADFGLPRAQVRARLERLTPDPESLSTAVWDGLHAALSRLRERGGGGVLVSFSHGFDGASMRSAAEVEALARGGGEAPPIAVQTVVYTGRGTEGLPALERLARRSGGRAFALSDFEGAAAPMLTALRSGYTVRFHTPLDGTRHGVTVRVDAASGTLEVAYPQVVTPGGGPARSSSGDWRERLRAVPLPVEFLVPLGSAVLALLGGLVVGRRLRERPTRLARRVAGAA